MRAGTFSSSSVYKLIKKGSEKGFSRPGMTYIQEKRMELRLGRELVGDTNAKPTNWGTFMERRAFDLMDLKYSLVSKERLYHSEIKHWSGMPDVVTSDLIGDIKCPWTLKSFCEMVDAMDAKNLKEIKPEYYWQLVSNAILADVNTAVLIVYAPYREELSEIRDMAEEFDGDQNKIAFINWAGDEQLPYLIKGKHYQNLNTYEFEVSREDKDLLTARVIEAQKLLLA